MPWYDDSELLHHWVPARNADGKPVLRDLVTGHEQELSEVPLPDSEEL